MTVLLDSHAKAAIEDPANRKLVSVASCWEIAIKVGNGKLNLDSPSAVFIPRELARNGFELLEISLSHVTAVESLALHHRDPFDRLLIVQAQGEGIPLISVDGALDAYGVMRIW